MNVLFTVFNRPDVTSAVASRIKEAGPSKLYVFADGPREDIALDRDKCARVRDILVRETAHLNVELRFEDTNLGPLYAVRSALDWLFTQEEEGIVIEDDCLPDISFFPFCQELLERYRRTQEVFMISGSNFLPHFAMPTSYVFSRLALVWGWATWKRAWEKSDVSMKAWPDYTATDDLAYFGEWRNLVYGLVHRQYLDPRLRTWGVVWRAAFLANHALSIVPKNNLVRNIGFGHPDATHHKECHRVCKLPVKPLWGPLIHRQEITPVREFDQRSLRFYYGRNGRPMTLLGRTPPPSRTG